MSTTAKTIQNFVFFFFLNLTVQSNQWAPNEPKNQFVNISEICKPENSTLDLSKMDLTLLSFTFSTTTWNLTCRGYRYFNVSTVPMVTCDVTGWTVPDVECREFAGPTKFSHVSHKQYGESFMVPLNYSSISTGLWILTFLNKEGPDLSRTLMPSRTYLHLWSLVHGASEVLDGLDPGGFKFP